MYKLIGLGESCVFQFKEQQNAGFQTNETNSQGISWRVAIAFGEVCILIFIVGVGGMLGLPMGRCRCGRVYIFLFCFFLVQRASLAIDVGNSVETKSLRGSRYARNPHVQTEERPVAKDEMPGTEGYQADPFDRARGVGFGGKLCHKLRKGVEMALKQKTVDEAAYKTEFQEYMAKCQLLNGGFA